MTPVEYQKIMNDALTACYRNGYDTGWTRGMVVGVAGTVALVLVLYGVSKLLEKRHE